MKIIVLLLALGISLLGHSAPGWPKTLPVKHQISGNIPSMYMMDEEACLYNLKVTGDAIKTFNDGPHPSISDAKVTIHWCHTDGTDDTATLNFIPAGSATCSLAIENAQTYLNALAEN